MTHGPSQSREEKRSIGRHDYDFVSLLDFFLKKPHFLSGVEVVGPVVAGEGMEAAGSIPTLIRSPGLEVEESGARTDATNGGIETTLSLASIVPTAVAASMKAFLSFGVSTVTSVSASDEDFSYTLSAAFTILSNNESGEASPVCKAIS